MGAATSAGVPSVGHTGETLCLSQSAAISPPHTSSCVATVEGKPVTPATTMASCFTGKNTVGRVSVEFLEDDEILMSGWGDMNKEFSDDLVGEWGVMLEKWDGQDKSRPKSLRKLCRKVRFDFVVCPCEREE